MTYAPIPNVYGRESKRMAVEWFNVNELTPGTNKPPPRRKTTVELPPNGRSAPKLETVEVKIGDWRLTFKPRPLVSPWFLPEYEIFVSGAQSGTLFLLELQDEFFQRRQSIGILIKAGEPTVVRKRWTGSNVVLRKVVPYQDDLTAHNAGPLATSGGRPFGTAFDLKTKAGNVFTRFFDQTTNTFYMSPYEGDLPLFGLTVGPYPIGSSYAGTLTAMELAEQSYLRQAPHTKRVKDGDKFKVTGYRQVAKAVGTLVLTGPPDQAGFIPPKPVIAASPTFSVPSTTKKP